MEDELLVALIDNNAAGFPSEIVLTTRRLYWSEREPRSVGGAAGSTHAVPIRVYGMDYGMVAPGVSVSGPGERPLGIALGSGQELSLEGGGRELAEALANFLRTVGKAAREGVEPSLGGLDPGLVERISKALPKVAEVTRRMRTLNAELNAFRRDLMSATRQVVVTPLLVAACILVYGVMAVRGVNPISPSAQRLLSWGANNGVRVVLRHEAWRLPASVFIHGGLLHLAINMWCLWNIGPLVERFFGNYATAVLYLAAGIGGAITSMATLPVRISVGASGAIFGLLGALLAFLLINRRSVPSTVLRPLRSSALSFVVFNTLFAAAVPNIDQAAHLGGLATGFLGGLMLSRPWPVVHSRWLGVRRLALGLSLVGSILGAGVAAAQWTQRTLPPLARFEDFASQAAAAIDEFVAISQALPQVADLATQAANATSKGELTQTLRTLQDRAVANLGRLSRVVTTDPDLHSIRQALINGQAAQIATIAGDLEYLDSPTPDRLTGPYGVLVRHSMMIRLFRELENRQRAYLESNGLTARGTVHGD
jgi:rhomboid protease GluP